jgi:FkbM family methyltransferase
MRFGNLAKRLLRQQGYDIVRYREPPVGTLAESAQIVSSSYRERPVRFFVSNPNDHIQREHQAGRFYEQEELDVIGKRYDGGVFVDVGANVGNHLLFAALHLGADRLVAFEPNPPAYTILGINVVLNDLADRVTIHRVGLSREASRAAIHEPINNLGGARLEKVESGGIEMARGDALLSETALGGRKVGFIKMDVEGFELDALAGLEGVIQRDRPSLFIEVENANIPRFRDWVTEQGYVIADSFRRYPDNENFMIIPT